jgi:hypothetical protein
VWSRAATRDDEMRTRNEMMRMMRMVRWGRLDKKSLSLLTQSTAQPYTHPPTHTDYSFTCPHYASCASVLCPHACPSLPAHAHSGSLAARCCVTTGNGKRRGETRTQLDFAQM